MIMNILCMIISFSNLTNPNNAKSLLFIEYFLCFLVGWYYSTSNPFEEHHWDKNDRLRNFLRDHYVLNIPSCYRLNIYYLCSKCIVEQANRESTDPSELFTNQKQLQNIYWCLAKNILLIDTCIDFRVLCKGFFRLSLQLFLTALLEQFIF